jgi:hypothetical protein
MYEKKRKRTLRTVWKKRKILYKLIIVLEGEGGRGKGMNFNAGWPTKKKGLKRFNESWYKEKGEKIEKKPRNQRQWHTPSPFPAPHTRTPAASCDFLLLNFTGKHIPVIAFRLGLVVVTPPPPLVSSLPVWLPLRSREVGLPTACPIFFILPRPAVGEDEGECKDLLLLLLLRLPLREFCSKGGVVGGVISDADEESKGGWEPDLTGTGAMILRGLEGLSLLLLLVVVVIVVVLVVFVVMVVVTSLVVLVLVILPDNGLKSSSSDPESSNSISISLTNMNFLSFFFFGSGLFSIILCLSTSSAKGRPTSRSEEDEKDDENELLTENPFIKWPRPPVPTSCSWSVSTSDAEHEGQDEVHKEGQDEVTEIKSWSWSWSSRSCSSSWWSLSDSVVSTSVNPGGSFDIESRETSGRTFVVTPLGPSDVTAGLVPVPGSNKVINSNLGFSLGFIGKEGIRWLSEDGGVHDARDCGGCWWKLEYGYVAEVEVEGRLENDEG